MSLMSFGEYARHRGCTLRAVQKALGDPDKQGVRHGRIATALVVVLEGKWPKIDSDRADILWALNTDAAKRSTLFTPNDAAVQANSPGHVDPAPLPAPSTASAPADPAPPPDNTNDELAGASAEIKNRYHAARAEGQEIDAENKRLDLAERKNNLLRYDEALQRGVTLLRSLRDSLGQIGARIAPALSVMTDVYDIEQRINTEIEAALSQVSAERLLIPAQDEDEDDTPPVQAPPPA